MLNQAEILSYLKNRKDFYLREYKIIKIGLFGSFSTNEFNSKSDIDLLIEFKPNTKNLFELKRKLKEELQIKFNRKIDLCREKYLNTYFKKQILDTAIYA